MNQARLDELVSPFYLDFMRRNSLTPAAADLLPAVLEAGRTTTTYEVVQLLRDSWRTEVMGAWYALLHPRDEIGDALAIAFERCGGSLTSPPYAVAVAILLGVDAVPTMLAYVEKDAANQWGECGFVAAALENLGATGSPCEPHEDDRRDFALMLSLAQSVAASARIDTG